MIVKINGIAIANIQGSNTNYFSSSTFVLTAGQLALTAPQDSFYRSFSHEFLASTPNNIVSFVLSDLSPTSHKYWIKNINLK